MAQGYEWLIIFVEAMKRLISKLGAVGSVSLSGRGPQDGVYTWLETLKNITFPIIARAVFF